MLDSLENSITQLLLDYLNLFWSPSISIMIIFHPMAELHSLYLALKQWQPNCVLQPYSSLGQPCLLSIIKSLDTILPHYEN